MVPMPPSIPLPAWAFVPGHRPHPRRDPRGHSYGAAEPSVTLPLDAADPTIARGRALFDAGYYWEAHEVFEAVWIAAGRTGAVAEFARAVVQLAAAGVKTRQGRRKGATRLAGAAHGRLVAVAATTSHVLGSAVAEWVAFAEAVQTRCETGAADPDLAVECLFGPAPW